MTIKQSKTKLYACLYDIISFIFYIAVDNAVKHHTTPETGNIFKDIFEYLQENC